MPTLPYITDLEFVLDEDPITVADNKFIVADLPWAGRILSNRNGPLVRGFIENAGTGAGTYTSIQIRNSTQAKNYFSTKPKFQVDDKDASNHASLSGGVLDTYQEFKGGDHLRIDVKDIPGGSDSAHAVVWLTVEMYREQS